MAFFQISKYMLTKKKEMTLAELPSLKMSTFMSLLNGVCVRKTDIVSGLKSVQLRDLNSFKIMIVFHNTSADFVLISTDV